MDPEQLALLRRISDEPDDDALRLVYADWLEEHGAAGAAGFIRAHLGMERALVTEPDELGSALHAEQVRNEVCGPLLAPLLDLGLEECANRARDGAGCGVTFRFRRGLVEALEVYGGKPAQRLAERAADALTRTPLKHLAVLPYNSMDLGYEPERDPVRLATLTKLLQSPEAVRLRSLSLDHHGLGEGVAGLLLALPHLRADLVLSLHGNRIGNDMRAALRERFPRLRCDRYQGPQVYGENEGEIPF